MDLLNDLKKMKILLIDDDEWIRDSMGLFFDSQGCNFLALETAEEAMERLKNQSYEIIIADYKLPGMDGLEFFKKIRETHPCAIKILISAYEPDTIPTKELNMEIDDFIPKPLTSENILSSLSHLIAKN